MLAGSSAHKLVRIVNQNLLYVRNPSFNPVYFIQPDVNSHFNALNVHLERRLSQGLQLNANYRFSKSIDTLSYEGPGGGNQPNYLGDLASEVGPSDFDVRHSFNVSGLYELPFFRHRRDLAGKLLGGFQLTGIVTGNTGFPWTPKIFADLRQPSGEFFGPIRPTAYLGGALNDTSNEAFLRPGGNFPGGGAKYFSRCRPSGRGAQLIPWTALFLRGHEHCEEHRTAGLLWRTGQSGIARQFL